MKKSKKIHDTAFGKLDSEQLFEKQLEVIGYHRYPLNYKIGKQQIIDPRYADEHFNPEGKRDTTPGEYPVMIVPTSDLNQTMFLIRDEELQHFLELLRKNLFVEGLTRWQRFKFWFNGYLYMEHRKKKNWKDPLPFYLLKCKDHGYQVSYSHGNERLECEYCEKKNYEKVDNDEGIVED